MIKRMVILLLIGMLAGAVRAQAPPEEETFEPGTGKYLLVLIDPSTDVVDPKTGKKPKEPDVTRHGGKVLSKGGRTRVIKLPVAAANKLRKEENVAFMQRIWLGESLENWEEESEAAAVPRGEDEAFQLNDLTWETGTYLYDGSGNIKKIGTDTYTYDSAGRLIRSVVQDLTETYHYDAFGNLLQKTTGGVAAVVGVDSTSNRVAGETYDAAGNMITRRGQRAYGYDSLAMMATVRDPIGMTRRMLYGPDEERIAVVIEENMKNWTLRDFSGRVLRDYYDDGSVWSWVQDYVYGEGRLLAGDRQQYTAPNGQTFWGKRHYHTDHLGAVRLITTQDRARISSHDFQPFGIERTDPQQERKNIDVSMQEDRRFKSDSMKFTSHERDFLGWYNWDNTEYLDYMHARYYDPNLGRFLSVDPGKDWDMSKPQSWNMYAYVRNNPLNMTDPTGRNAEVKCETTQDSKGSSQTNCTATVVAQIVASNRAERRTATAFANAATAYWNNQTARGQNGENIRFNVSFNIVAPGKAHAGMDTLTVARGAGRSQVQMTLDLGRPGPLTPDRGTIFMRDSTGNPSGMRGIAPHETGHLFGLRDLYPPSGVPAFIPGRQHGIMEMAQPSNNADYGWWVLSPHNGNTIFVP